MPAPPTTGTPEPPRRTRRGDERDAQIRAHATALFLERGYNGVSIDDILREVGGSKTNVYSFYGGKDGLFLAVMEATIKELVQPMLQVRVTGLPLEMGLLTFAETLLSVLLQQRHLAFQRLVIAEALRHPQIGSSWYANGPAATHAILERFLREQQALGRVRPQIDPAATAVLFHDMVIFDLLNRAMMAIDGGPTQADIAATIRRAVEITTMAIGTPAQ
ncbi:MAG TPA: TetR/AcrR family transcriptional regulator [Acetobacteraceae bacterium]|jgi:AcrR family transcriptional regulator